MFRRKRYTFKPPSADPQPPAPRRRRWVRWVIGLAAAALVAVLAVAGYAYWQADQILEEFSSGYKAPIVNAARPELDVKPVNQVPGLKEATTILLIGSDIRPGASEKWGRSDTMLVARIYPETKTVSVLSLPRDLLVPIPGHGYNKINAAYSYGGPSLLIETLREYLGVPINHFFQVDFESFGSLVDELGGVYLPVDQRYFHSNEGLHGLAQYSEIDLEPGYQKLNAIDALSFVRFRHDDSDFYRAARQQLFLREVGRQLREAVGGSVFQLRDLTKTIAKATISDLDDLGETLALARTLQGIPAANITRVTMEASNYNGYDLLASETQKKEALEKWTNPEGLINQQSKRPRSSANDRALRGLAGRLAARTRQWTPFKPAARIDGLSPSQERRVGRLKRWAPLRGLGKRLLDYAVERIDRRTVRRFTKGGRLKDKKAQKAPREAPLSTRIEKPSKILVPSPESEELFSRQPDGLQLCRPSKLPSGFHWPKAEDARNKFSVNDHLSLAVYATKASGVSILWNFTTWQDPPVLASADDAIEIGGRQYHLYWESGSLRQVAWRIGSTRAWVTNTLRNEVSPQQMLALARSCKKL